MSYFQDYLNFYYLDFCGHLLQQWRDDFILFFLHKFYTDIHVPLSTLEFL